MKQEIRKFIIELLVKEDNKSIKIEDDLDLSTIGLTSVNMINVIVFLEEKFDFEFDDEFLLMDRINTINKIYESARLSIDKG